MNRVVRTGRYPSEDRETEGLSSAEARERQVRFGPNDILEPDRGHLAALVRDTAADPMIWFLAGTAILYAALGMAAEAVTLVVAAVPLIFMDFYLHRRTRASAAGLAGLLAASATVVRDGKSKVIPARDVVPGDLALVAVGEGFPADGILVGGEGIQTDEASLTGEAHPVTKHPVPRLPRDGEEIAVIDTDCGFAGTRLLTGRAILRVVWTGGETLYGEIVRSARVAVGRTPLQKAVGRLVTAAVWAAVVLCAALAAVRLAQGQGWVDALLSAVTLAIAALPEEFPVVFTMFLGVGVYRLSRRQALVRRAVSVENIGRVTSICSDKTGTITEGRLVVRHVEPVIPEDEARLLAMAAIASRRGAGDPLDEAVIAAALAGGADLEGSIVATFPFTENRRRETVLARTPAGLIAAMKGSPEIVLPRCALTTTARDAIEGRVATLAAEGHKVIAVAMRAVTPDPVAAEPEDGYTCLGLLAVEDPVREGVREAVAECHAAGIHTLMVTGDHPDTAIAVARDIGLGSGAPVAVRGDDLDDFLRRDGAAGLRRIQVVARALPAQKLRIVQALKEAGEVVAVTGDGVNDVPALQAADVGIAMGGRSTRSARDIAAIVLLDDNFRSIVGAIGEGRQLFENLRRSFLYLLAIHIPFVLTATIVPLIGAPLLYLPIHIVWIEMIIHPGALLVFQDPPQAGPLGRRVPPRAAPGGAVRFFSRREWAVILGSGSLITLAVILAFARELASNETVGTARAAAMAVLVTASGTLTAGLSRLRTRAARVVTGLSVVVSLVLIQTAWTAVPLHLSPLPSVTLATAIFAGVVAAGLPILFERLPGLTAPPRP